MSNGVLARADAGGAIERATRREISAARARLQAALREWAGRYPVFEPARLPALALTTAAFLPAARDEDRELVALVSLWIIAFDALVDEGPVAQDTLTALAWRYCDLAAGREDREPGGQHAGESPAQLEAALREIAARLAAYAPAPGLWAWWSASCRATIAAIVRQRELGRAGGAALGYDAALPLLLDSIGVRPYLAAGAIAGREPGLAARLPALSGLAGECALAIRLANDLRTWEKDEREGGFSTLVTLTADLARTTPVLPAPAARERALRQLADRLAASRARCRAWAAAPGSGELEAGMARLVEVVAGIYATGDFHTFDPAGAR